MAHWPKGLQDWRAQTRAIHRKRSPVLDCDTLGRYDAPMSLRNTSFLTLCVAAATGLVLYGPSESIASDERLVAIQTPSGITIQAEIADTPLKRSVGLMYRDHLQKDHGMLFFFGQPEAWSFWMKNTKISLDLIWLDGKKRVTHIERNVPICTKTDDSCPQYRPNSDDAIYVLEITGGTIDRYKIEKGTKLQFGQP